jgi:hypothetical protein
LTFNDFVLSGEDEKKEKPRDEETAAVKFPYPKAVFFIISTEFCERFSFYGMKSKSCGQRAILNFTPRGELGHQG